MKSNMDRFPQSKSPPHLALNFLNVEKKENPSQYRWAGRHDLRSIKLSSWIYPPRGICTLIEYTFIAPQLEVISQIEGSTYWLHYLARLNLKAINRWRKQWKVQNKTKKIRSTRWSTPPPPTHTQVTVINGNNLRVVQDTNTETNKARIHRRALT